MSYTCGVSDEPLLGVTIGDMFDRMVETYPDNEALISCHQGIRYTYRELQEQVDLCARALMAVGIEKQDRVGILSANFVEWTITQFATSKIGAILVNINPSYRVHELEFTLKQSGCAALITMPKFKSSDYLNMLYELAPELKNCQPGCLKSEKLPALKIVVRHDSESSVGVWSWPQFLAHSEKVTDQELLERQRELDCDDPINIQFTSGTTGSPKGATLTHHNIINNGYFTARTMRFTQRDRLVVPVPLYHCFGMVMANLGCITHGATLIYPSAGFDPLSVLKAIEAERATAVFGVPTMFIAELEHPEFSKYDMSSMRTGIMAGAPCPVEIMKRVKTEMHMSEVEIAYGMTETSPVSLQTRPDTPLENQVGTVGQVHPHQEVKIIDRATGRTVSIGQPGELCTRGYNVMLGYWNNEDATRRAIDANGWMHSGDLGVMDEEKYVNIVGRIKDMIVRGGENVYPREIEEFLLTHHGVCEAHVIGLPDAKYGEVVMAWIKLRNGEATNVEEIQKYCRASIAHYKVPKYIKFVESFPMTVSGKVKKYKMREESIRELGLEKAAQIPNA